ncbi:MAG: oligosaccharide flippase family protein [Niastella sp.]|nr:oligosaccharide flippase family protein [Niastella sp.]
MRTMLPTLKLYRKILPGSGKGHALSENIKKNIFGGLMVKGLSIIINLLYVPLLIHYLDSERYGVWIALTSFLSWFQFFDIGIGNGLRNKLTQALVNKDHDTAKSLISTSYILVFLIFSAIALLYCAIGFYINWAGFLNVKLVGNHELQVLTLIVFTSLCLTFVAQLIQPILFAIQKSALSVAFPTISNLISFITIYFLSKTSLPPLLTAGIVLSVVPLFTFTVGSIILYNTWLKHIKPGIKHIDFSHAKHITALGFKFLFIQIASIILNSSASIILIKLFGPDQVTIYNIVFKYFQVILILNAIVVTPLWSGFTEMLVKKDYSWIRNTIKKINKISLVLSLGILFMAAISPWVFELWIGDKVRIPIAITITMALYFIQIVFISVYNMFINGSGKIKLAMYFTFFEIAAYILLAFVLSKYVMGVYGVIVASIITKSFTFVLQYIQVNKIIDEKATGIWNQ